MPIKHQDHTTWSTINRKPIYYQLNIEDIISGDAKSIIVAVDSPTKANFVTRKKHWLEKLLLNDNGFDKGIYVGSDEPTLQSVLEDRELQNKILEVLEGKYHYPCDSIEIVNEEKMFYLKFNLKKGLKPKKIEMELFVNSVIDKLLLLEKLFLLNSIEAKEEIKDYNRQYWVRFILTFLVGISFFYRIFILDDVKHYIIDDMRWFLYSSGVALFMAFGAFIYIFRQQRESSLKLSTSKRYFIGSFFIGLLFFSLVIQESNIFLDDSSSNVTVAYIEKKEKSPKTLAYYFILRKNSIEGLDKVRIDGSIYKKRQKREMVRVSVKEGFLGIRWVFDVE